MSKFQFWPNLKTKIVISMKFRLSKISILTIFRGLKFTIIGLFRIGTLYTHIINKHIILDGCFLEDHT